MPAVVATPLPPRKRWNTGHRWPTNTAIAAAGTGYWRGQYQPKRLLTIYDGPTYADGNTFLNVGAWECNAQPCAGKKSASECVGYDPQTKEAVLPCGIYTSTTQPQGPSGGYNMVVMDTSIGWKQPNGFYYPPAFAPADPSWQSPELIRRRAIGQCVIDLGYGRYETCDGSRR